jgi:hypothetical protein
MIDWRSFGLLHALTRFGSRNEVADDFAWEGRDEPQPGVPDVDVADLRERQEALLAGISHTLRKIRHKPYRKLIDRLTAISQRPVG